MEHHELKAINYKSCFDVIGPIMVGPSSSHTAGAIRIGALARTLFGGTPTSISCRYYESFAQTHKGHGTDYAIISGVLGFEMDDARVPNAVNIALSQNIDIEFIEDNHPSPVNHANTADLTLRHNNKIVRLIGTSIGGGMVEVRYLQLDTFVIEPNGPIPIVVLLTKNTLLKQHLKDTFTKLKMDILDIKETQNETHTLYVFELGQLITNHIKTELYRILEHETFYILE
ncbi:serine dehydratase [Granulicatella sp. zg-ZJ]|uniref:serine dehydratase beta chain n=1 Tax=Granulicatella sp. zg-ZJ TaxID=2678504 RepID=UPI0013D51177|nr:serine dehydratase beta chain [Granulicatella sp. zg-ZJ]NEW62504.1 serine dehydratase [Granulicatella sp. zg-ZJ]